MQELNDVLNENNILFEMTANTETINIQPPKYSDSIININLMKNFKNNFDIILTIGNVIYKGLINDIDRNNIINNDFIVMCLVYTTSDVTFYINKQRFNYKNTDNFRVKLGSAPVIINKNGTINMDLYNFIYYKYVIPINEIDKLTKYNYYYLSGLDNVITNNANNNCLTPQDTASIQSKIIDDKIKELRANYIQTLEQRSSVSKANTCEIKKKIDIKPLEYQYDNTSLRNGVNLTQKENNNNWFFNWFN